MLWISCVVHYPDCYRDYTITSNADRLLVMTVRYRPWSPSDKPLGAIAIASSCPVYVFWQIDKVLPRTHMLSPLRTGMARINNYLHRIGAAESDMCNCEQAVEMMGHFSVRCTKWDAQRDGMR